MKKILTKYFFWGIELEILGYLPKTDCKYNPFRKAEVRSSTDLCHNHVTVEISPMFCSDHITGDIIYDNEMGIQIRQDNTKIKRVYYNPFSGKHYAYFIENVSPRTVFLSKEEFQLHTISETGLLNLIAIEEILHTFGKYILHSSMIKLPHEDAAILFTAPSGTGKSTQAELWRKYRGATVLNGDRAAIWKENDVWYASSGPWAGTSGIMCHKTLPLKAIIILEQSQENVVTNPRMITKIARLMEQLTINPWNKSMKMDVQNMILNLCDEIPVWHLACTPDENSVKALETVIYEH